MILNPYQDSIHSILSRAGLDGVSDKRLRALQSVAVADVQAELSCPAGYSPERLETLLSPAAGECLESMASAAHALTQRRFGNTMQFYAPLYVSNHCVNQCTYCGFDVTNRVPRKRLSVDETVRDARALWETGIRHVLLLAGEDPRFVTVDYLSALAEKLRPLFASIAVEIHPMSAEEYRVLLDAGIDGVVCYQETYHREVYARYHLTGPKSDYDDRLSAHDRSGSAGMRRIGIGYLLGLSDWRLEALALAEHAQYLIRKYWRSQIAISFPRLRPADNVDGVYERVPSDRDLAQLVVAFRLCFPDAGLVLSTRESAYLRDHLCRLGITHMSAGSKTNPGAYSDASESSLKQFEIEDTRTPREVARMLSAKGYDPVWKDWDAAFHKP